MEIADVLRETELFDGLDEEHLDRLAEVAEARVYEPRRIIFHQGDRAERFFVLRKGTVKLYTATTDGKEHTLYIVEEDEPFCICTLFGNEDSPLSAVTLSRSEVFSFPDDVVRRVAYEAPRLLVNVLRVYNRRLLSSMYMIENLALRDIYQRVASFLLHTLRTRGGDTPHVRLNVPRQEVARILGTTPETISRVLARMTAEGLIDAKGRQIEILDDQALSDIAG